MRSQEIWAWSELRHENNQSYQQMISVVVGIYYYTFMKKVLAKKILSPW